MVRMSAILLFCFERCIAVSRFGIAIAARMPMIATTISSSIRVKPFCFLFIHSSKLSITMTQSGGQVHDDLEAIDAQGVRLNGEPRLRGESDTRRPFHRQKPSQKRRMPLGRDIPLQALLGCVESLLLIA